MSYRRFKFSDENATPATVATLRQFGPMEAKSKPATVATNGSDTRSVAKSQMSHGVIDFDALPRPKNVATVAGPMMDADNWRAAFDERAGHLEYSEHLTREEAERIALADTTAAHGPAPFTIH